MSLFASKTREARGKTLGLPVFTNEGGFQLHAKGLAKLGRRGEFVSFADHAVDVRVETAGELSSRITATRLLATGIFALALRKKTDTRVAFVTVSVDGEPRWIEEISADKAAKAHRFAVDALRAAREARNGVASRHHSA